MDILTIVLTAAGAAAVVALISYVCFRMAFYAPPRKPADPNVIETPVGEIYDPYRASMEQWARETRALPQEQVSIQSHDGLTLHGTYYEFAPGAPIELMFHGYRGNAERDLSGGVQRCFKLGRSALVVDQRCSGRSGGNVITFGIREHQDCLRWVDFMLERFGSDVKIILTGISMGAATVMMAGGCDLPPNVLGILADCGYTSAKDIMLEVIRKMGLPPRLCYPFVKLGARLYGRLDIEESSPVEMMKKCKVPVLFFHGEADDFVPCRMSEENFAACASPRKKLITVPGAGHGLSYPLAPKEYLQEAKYFFGPEGTAL